MEPHPYKSPIADTALKIRPRTAGTLFRPFEGFGLSAFSVLLLAAMTHRFQLSNVGAYRTSSLIFVELLGVVVVTGIMPVAFARALYLAFQNRLGGAILNLLICCLAFGVAGGAMWIDAPTLIYAT